jgi:concentrative nucleoside transporter, CNT family
MNITIYNFVSLIGIFLLLGCAWLISKHRRDLSGRVIVAGLIIQCIFAFFIFIVPVGTQIFLVINRVVVAVLDSATAGIVFVFGPLGLSPGTVGESGETSIGFILATQALPAVIFFASLVAILYYLGLMPFLVKGFSYIFSKLMRISGAESLSASSNIFVGIESSLVIRPYLEKMTKSELCTILAAGMGTIASSMLATYVMLLRDQFPNIAGHLVSATILAAPGAVVMAKIIYPETDKPETLGITVKPFYERENNVIEAIINGANTGVKLVVGIIATLIALLGLVSLIDLALGFLGGHINTITGMNADFSLRALLSVIAYPFAVIIGIPLADAGAVAQVLGERLILTEVVAYRHLADMIADGTISDPRSAVVAVYALCGFAHVASLAIFVGGVSAVAPSRIRELSEVGIRALIAATLGCLLTAAWSGIFYTQNSILFGQ